ncbi:MAG: hypothetical protein KAH32_03190 [Chlamydiia bacterium]|nr:hypothetical protein [Chlamydiia bacterium]
MFDKIFLGFNHTRTPIGYGIRSVYLYIQFMALLGALVTALSVFAMPTKIKNLLGINKLSGFRISASRHGVSLFSKTFKKVSAERKDFNREKDKKEVIVDASNEAETNAPPAKGSDNINVGKWKISGMKLNADFGISQAEVDGLCDEDFQNALVPWEPQRKSAYSSTYEDFCRDIMSIEERNVGVHNKPLVSNISRLTSLLRLPDDFNDYNPSQQLFLCFLVMCNAGSQSFTLKYSREIVETLEDSQDDADGQEIKHKETIERVSKDRVKDIDDYFMLGKKRDRVKSLDDVLALEIDWVEAGFPEKIDIEYLEKSIPKSYLRELGAYSEEGIIKDGDNPESVWVGINKKIRRLMVSRIKNILGSSKGSLSEKYATINALKSVSTRLTFLKRYLRIETERYKITNFNKIALAKFFGYCKAISSTTSLLQKEVEKSRTGLDKEKVLELLTMSEGYESFKSVSASINTLSNSSPIDENGITRTIVDRIEGIENN